MAMTEKELQDILDRYPSKVQKNRKKHILIKDGVLEQQEIEGRKQTQNPNHMCVQCPTIRIRDMDIKGNGQKKTLGIRNEMLPTCFRNLLAR